MNKYLTVIVIFSFVSSVFAQDRNLAVINYTASALKYNDTSAHARQFDAKFRLPVYRTFGITIGYKNVMLAEFPSSYTPHLHGITLQTAWLYKLTARRNLSFFVQAGLFSDMKDISGKDFRYSAGFRYRYRHSDKVSTGWGLAYARQFFGNQVIPFIDIDYKPNNKWSITGQFPVKPKVLYHFSEKLRTGVELSGEAASYRLSSNNQFIQINQWTGLAKLEYQFASAWQLNFGIGRNFKQSYKLYNDAVTTSWTIITIPVGRKEDPVQKIDSKGLNVQLGISYNPFNRSL